MARKIEVIWSNNPFGVRIAHQMQEHIHACYQMYCCLSGSSTFIVDGKQIDVQDGNIFYISPNTPHCMLPIEPGNPWKTLEIKFYIHDEYLASNLPKESVTIQGNMLTKKMLLYIQSNWKSNNPYNLTNIDNILSSLLICFFIDNIHYTESSSNIMDTSSYSPIVKSIATYIEKNYHLNFCISNMSNDLSYNKNYLSTLFTKETGITIVEYLNLIKVRQAVISFSFYNRDVYTVCKATGFSNPSHFSRKFKELVGVSPRSFKAAFSSHDRNAVSKYYTTEPILNYSVCSSDELFASLKRLGEAVKQFEHQNVS